MFWVFISITSIFIVVIIVGIFIKDREIRSFVIVVGSIFLALSSLIMWVIIGVEESAFSENIPINKNELEIFQTPVNVTLTFRGNVYVFDLAKDVHSLKDTSKLFFYNHIEKNLYKETVANELFFSHTQLHELKEN